MNIETADIRKEVFTVNNAAFESLALKIFLFQYEKNPLYNQYCKTLKISPGTINQVEQIPFLPIQFLNQKR